MVVSISVGGDEVMVPVEVISECDVDDKDEYSLEGDVFPIVLIVFSLVLLEILFVAAINCDVDNSVSIDEVKSP
jgi:hypothetical protein